MERMLEDENSVTENEIETIDQIMSDIYHCL